MSSGIECAFSGFLPSEPDGLRTSQAGMPWLAFSAGVGDGDDKQWVRVVVFGERAQEIAPRLHKGGRVYVEGKLSQDEWKGKDGQQRHGLRVAAFRVELLNQIGRNRPRKEKAKASARAAPGSNQSDTALNDEVPW